MRRKSLPYFFSLFGLLSFILAGCSGAEPQISGIHAQATFETVACIGQNKNLKIRNNDPSEPQRIQGVHFELGTNNDKFFKIVEVNANGQTRTGAADLIEEIMLPPGGVMNVKVAYNPKKVTVGDETHATYLDIVLNGPRLGVMQVELLGKAPTAMEGCGQNSANTQEFEVMEIKTVIDHKDVANSSLTPLDLSAVEGTFKFDIDESSGKIILPTTGWPTVTLPLPTEVNGLNELNITLSEDAKGTFNNGEIDFDGSIFVLLESSVSLSGVTLSTGTINITKSEAPNLKNDPFTLSGSKLDDSGNMTIVIAAPLVGNSTLEDSSVGGGVFGAEIKLKRKN